MKRFISILCIMALMLSLSACGTTSDTSSSSEETEESAVDTASQTLVGQVEEVGSSTLTLLLGELSEAEEGMAAEAPGGDMEKPDGEDKGDGEAPDGEEPDGEMPDGEDAGDAEAGSDTSSSEETTDEESSEEDTAASDASGDDAQTDLDGEVPPDLPDGETMGDGGAPDGDMEMPDGEVSGGDMEMPDGEGMGDMTSGGMGQTFTAGDETVTLTVSDDLADALAELETGDIVQVETDADSLVTSIAQVETGGMGGETMGDGDAEGASFGGSSEVTQGTSANTIDTDGEISGETYTSTGDDENALRVDGATVTLDGITVDKSDGASSNTEDGDFYGMNAALLATDGAQVTITNATITSSAQNGNGVFSYGEGTVVNISGSTITTTADNSGGIQTTGGGTTNASDLTVETYGDSSAAIRSDRGGGTVNVNGGTYTSNGYNSPAVYSTAEITVTDATLTAEASEALVIEGANSITLEDCDVSGNMSDTEGTSSDTNVHNVMIYQSMSGDADVGTSTFSMTGGSLTGNNGDMFYVTNTHCILYLSGVDIENLEEDGYLLRICGNDASHGWGTAGQNGAQVEFTAEDQVLEGDIIVDTISTLTLTLTGSSEFTGTINIVDNEEGGEAVSDNAVVVIESGSTWTLTGDCTITSLTNNGTIDFNGYTITLADGTVLSD